MSEEGQVAEGGGPTIRLLPDSVINQIAAGEVVERPASVLKELLDNALDAGAGRIEVDVVDGGRRLVRVRDDGCGMGRDNALMSIERHATSKLRDLKDLDRISTMGFRGEALAAIAAVSQFTLTTNRRGDVAGTEIVVFGGKVQDVRDAGAPPGTDIAVRNLFFNVPARRKFLRSAQTEYTHIRQRFFLSALSRPDVEFTLRTDDEETCRLRGGGDALGRVRDFYGEEVARALRRVSFGNGTVEVGGWAGAPPYSRADREMQVVMVNGRPAGSPILNYAIQNAYRDLLPGGRYAPVFLTVDLPGEMVDVNVHPAKKEVRFRRPTEVRDVVIEAIRTAVKEGGIAGRKFSVGGGGLIPRTREVRVEGAGVGGGAAAGSDGGSGVGGAGVPPPPMAFPPRVARQEPLPPPAEPVAPAGGEARGEAVPAGSAGPAAPWTEYRVLGRTAGGYVVMETGEGIVLLEPRAAHERVLYEKWLEGIREGRVPTQGLLMPANVRLSPGQANAVRKAMGWLTTNGFGLSDFGGDSFLVDGLPIWLGDGEPSEVLSDLADHLMAGKGAAGTPSWVADVAAALAERGATGVKGKLDDAALRRLIGDLSKTEMPYTSPKGKPTVILWSWRELARKFGNG